MKIGDDPWLPISWNRKGVTSNKIYEDKFWMGTKKASYRNLERGIDQRQLFFKKDAEMILSLPLSNRVDEDFLAWHYDRRGLF